MSRNSIVSTTLLLAVALFAFAITPAAANTELPCLQWTGPNADNTFYSDNGFTCPTDEVINWILPRVIIGIVFIVLALLVFLSCPYVFAGRYCCNCCGSSLQRPGNCCCGGAEWDERDEQDKYAAYSDTEVRVAKFSTFFLAVLGAIIIILVYVGVSKLVTGFDDLTTGLSGGVDFFRDLVNDINRKMTRADNTTLMPQDAFDDINSNLDEFDEKLIKETKEPRELSRQVGAIVGYASLVPAAILFSSVIAAMLNIRICLPVVLILLCFFFQLIYALVGGSLLVSNNLLIKTVCNEVAAQQNKDPGVFQWYFIPRCERNTPFQKVKDDIEDIENTAVTEACNTLNDICDPPNTPYDATGAPQRIFTCDLSTCNSFPGLETVVANMAVKGDATGVCSASPCTLAACATSCTTNNNIRSTASDIYNSFQDASNAVEAYNEYVRPWLDCNALIDKVLDITFVPMCGFLPGGIDLLVGGFLLTVVALWIGIVVLFRGQKRFINKSRFSSDDSVGQMKGKYVAQNAATIVQLDPYGSGRAGGVQGVEMQHLNDPLMINHGDFAHAPPQYSPYSPPPPPPKDIL